ncbi:hypothetical protein CL689_02265 [Candidatus Saccharibacteria bacterium]|nr:hypothetical protein [Candidatus Saccharibacteria bacterium]
MEGERIKHPCFGQIKAARVQGRTTLYDSEFSHQNSITITISTSELFRSLSRNWHFEGNEIFKLEMSEAQWATFVSSVNEGSGVPCTLRRDHGQGVPGLSSPITDREKFKVEFGAQMNDAFARLEKLESLVVDSKLSGKSREEIVKSLNSVRASFTSSMPFIAEQFGKHMEQTVEKAKIEINAFSTQALIDAGRASLSNKVLDFDRPEGD